jgi:transcriptional regulator with XRE-family HTH domain
VDDAPSTKDLDLASVTTQSELAKFLRTVHLRADKPSFRSLEARTRHDSTPLSKTVLSEMLRGVRFPKKAVMVSFLRTCGVPDDQMAQWSRAWERIAELTQVSTPPAVSAGQASAAPSFSRLRQDLPDDASAENVSAGPLADIVGPQIETLRDQIDKLDADNRRLRLQLAALDRQRAGQEPRIVEPVNPRTAHNPIARRRELGALLHMLRVQKDLGVKEVAKYLKCSENKVRRMEANFRAGTPMDVGYLCDLYGVTDRAERDRMIILAVEGKQQAWWQSYGLSYGTYVGLEADALAISAFQSSVVHGLLHTADYARANHENSMPRFSSERIEMQIEVKLIRQGILVRDSPPRLAVVLDEAALHRMVGGRKVMAAQLAKILEMSGLPNVVVQVLPFELGAHPALESNFTILQLPDPTPGVVFVEGLIGSTYLDRPEDLKRYHDIFRKLQSIALSPEETADWIADLSHSYANIDISHEQRKGAGPTDVSTRSNS